MPRASQNRKGVIIAIILLGAAMACLCCYFAFYNRTAIACNDREALEQLLRRDFSETEIKDAVLEYGDGGTRLCLLLKERPGREIRRPGILKIKGEPDDEFTNTISPGDLEILNRFGITADHMIGYDVSYGEVRVGFSDVPFEVCWYQIQDRDAHDFNAVLISCIPRRVVIDSRDGIIEE